MMASACRLAAVTAIALLGTASTVALERTALSGGAVASLAEQSEWARNTSQRYDPLALAFLQQDSPCSDGPHVTKEHCLTKHPKCMWISMATKNLCLPCEFGGVNIPCPSMNAVYSGQKVKNCVMTCKHQNVLTKVSACTDVSGSISTAQCFQKGLTTGAPPLQKCMWTGFVVGGQGKSVCGPCSVAGIGTIPCYNLLDKGPEPGSTVMGCASQCDQFPNEFGTPCDPIALPFPIPAVPNCWPVPPAPPVLVKGTVPLETLKIHTEKGAPQYYAVTVDAPYGLKQFTEAAAIGMRSAGWAPGNVLPPDAAVVMYGPPPPDAPTLPPSLRVMYGPPPPGMKGVPPPGYGYGTVPPEANVAAAGGASLLEVSVNDLLRFGKNDPLVPAAWSGGEGRAAAATLTTPAPDAAAAHDGSAALPARRRSPGALRAR